MKLKIFQLHYPVAQTHTHTWRHAHTHTLAHIYSQTMQFITYFSFCCLFLVASDICRWVCACYELSALSTYIYTHIHMHILCRRFNLKCIRHIVCAVSGFILEQLTVIYLVYWSYFKTIFHWFCNSLELVAVPPNIDDSLSSSDVIVREGANISLRCRASGSPRPIIKWKRDDNSRIAINKNHIGKCKGNGQLASAYQSSCINHLRDSPNFLYLAPPLSLSFSLSLSLSLSLLLQWMSGRAIRWR